MTLKAVLWFKIVVTVGLWAVPLMFVPPGLYHTLGFPESGTMLFLRLLAAAFVALLVGYVLGVRALNRGEFPAQTVAVGLVSNGLACLIIVVYGIAGEYGGWGGCARAFMWSSAAATGLVTLGLLLTGRRPPAS